MDPVAVDRNTEKSPALFGDVVFTVVRSVRDDKKELEEKVIAELIDNGAQYAGADVKQALRDGATHIISSTSDFPEYTAALDSFVHVVKPSWVDICIAKQRVTNPRQYSPDPALFLSDVVVTCADIPPGDQEAIIGGIIAMGGQYSAPLTRLVTHVVALTMDSQKCQTVQELGLKTKIVLPHWFDDCLKLGKKIDEQPYTLPNPEILSVDISKPVRHNDNRDLQGASSADLPTVAPSLVTSPSTSRRSLTVFENKRIMLSSDLGIRTHLRAAIEDIVRTSGGDITTSVDKADTFVNQYRDGDEYLDATRAGKDVGNLSWLYYMVAHNTWTSPMRRLLHYPIPRHGIPGFSKFKISLSNYTGEARVCLESLVKVSGGEFTKTLKQDNTHLITAHAASEKCQAAKEWNINLVNHLWLEESYAKGEIQTLTTPRYTTFPRRTNLGEVVGQTQIDRDAIERLCNNSQTVSPRKQVPAPQEQSARPDGTINGTIGQDEAAVNGHPTKPPASKPPQTAMTPGASRRVDKENITPSSTTSLRSAKAVAAQKLHDLAPDIAAYEKERKRVGGVTHGRERKSAGSPAPAAPPRKRSLSAADGTEADDAGATAKPQKLAKRAKTASGAFKTSTSTHKLMLSGYTRWINALQTEASDRARLKQLGVSITQEPRDCTIIAAPRMMRTLKFVCGIAVGPEHIVNTTWVDACLALPKDAGKDAVPDPEGYLLTDEEFETANGFRLADSLERARKRKESGAPALLARWRIWSMEAVRGGWESYKGIVEGNGGECLLWRGRSTDLNPRVKAGDEDTEDSTYRTATSYPAQPPPEPTSEAGDEAGDETDLCYLLSASDKGADETKLQEKFRKQAEKQSFRARVVSPDWLLHVAMKQALEWNDRWLIA